MLKRADHARKRFLPEKKVVRNREIYSEGDWINIQEHLRLCGWDYIQRESIHSIMKSGLPLKYAVSQTAKNLGRCPLGSKKLFNN